MAQITISRSIFTVATVMIDDNSKLIRQLNGVDTVNLNFILDEYIEFIVGDEVTFRGRVYKIYQIPAVKKHSLVKYEYSLLFEGPQYELINVLFLLDGQGEFYLTGTADDFIQLLTDNMNRVFTSSYSVGNIPSTDYKNLHFDNENCLQVLQRVADEFELEYINDGGEINLYESIGVSTGLEFQYHDGLRNIKRLKVGNKNIITRLYPFGSERNLDYSYGAKRLKLTPAYIEQNTATYGVIEAVKVFEDIYPHFSGVVDSVPGVNQIIDTSINFDLNDYLIEGETAKIVFLTGNLAGYEFEIISYNPTTYTVTFKSYTNEEGLTLPTTSLDPEAGHKFTFVDIKMPSAYISSAEVELLDKAEEFLAENSNPNVVYEIEMDEHNLRSSSTSLDVGDEITIVDTQLSPSGVTLRILEFSQSIASEYKYSVKIGEGILTNYFQKIESEQKETKRETGIKKDDSDKRTRRSLQLTRELQDLIFDPDGYFDPVNIKPLSIETGMLTVNMRGQQLVLKDVEFLQNPSPFNNTGFSWSAGTLIHYTIDPDAIKTWNIAASSAGSLTASTSYYIYARCTRTTTTGTIVVSTTQYTTDYGATYYYFLLGILHAAIDSQRAISLTFGSSSITGRVIKTGRISSQNGDTYFDLDNNQLVMASGMAGGFSVDTEKLYFSALNKNLYLNNAIKTSGYFGRGFSIYNSDANYATKQVAAIAVGQIRPKDTIVFTATTEYGFEVIRIIGPGVYRHMIRIGENSALIAGWDMSESALYRDVAVSEGAGMSPGDYPFYAGSNYANRASAPFRVNTKGYVIATKFIHPYVLSNDIIVSHNAVAISYAGAPWSKMKTITLGPDLQSSLTLRFTYLIDVDPGNNTSARIYRNGSAAGPAHNLIGSDATFTEDIAGWNAGDTAELWMSTTYPGANARCSNFRLLGTFTQDLNEVSGTIS